MKKYIFLVPVLVIIACGQPADNQEEISNTIIYPETRKDTTVVDDYFGTMVPDPYRWLEDDNSDETKAWVVEQNKVTNAYLDSIPQRKQIVDRMTELWNYAKQTTPFRKGDHWFHYRNDGIQNQSVLYIQDDLTNEPRILLDPNTLSEDGTVALSGTSFDKEGNYMAYRISHAGSDWAEIFLLDVNTGEMLDDHIEWVKFSGMNWQGDGFYYARYDAPIEGDELSQKNEYHKVYYHKIGTSQDQDELTYMNEDFAQRNYGVSTTDDQGVEFLWGSESTSGNQVSYRFQGDGNDEWHWLDETFEADYSIIDRVGAMQVLVKTSKNAPMNRVVLINLKAPEIENWVDIIPESEHLLESVSKANGKLVVKYLEDVKSKLYIYNYEGEREGEIELPGLGVAGFSGKKEDTIAFYTFTNYVTPSRIYKYNMETGTSEPYWEPDIDFNPDEYETNQVFFPSKDGTKIPMFITHKKGLVMDGNNPCFLYGYGGFKISIKPAFSTQRLVFLENGGILAVPNMRGGGEYGEEWHKAGTKLQKQNVFDDFIAAAEYLISEKYTSTSKLACHGRSNGGLLIGAVMTQRPDLWGVCLPKVGVLDMLRYHTFTIGWAWAVDYGRSDEEDQFPNLLGYSPLHNVEEVCYPPTMVITGDHDDRVVPGHSNKFAATLQAKNTCDNPMLIRIDVDAGHGAGKPVSKQIAEFADQWAFVFHHLGMDVGTNKIQ